MPEVDLEEFSNQIVQSGEYVDVMPHGYIALEDTSGGDVSIVNAARVSYANQTDEMKDADKGLVRYLAKHRHGTPFEHNFLRFRVRGPLFVFYEWHRHRMGSFNEESARYVKMRGDFVQFRPDEIRMQTGKAGHYEYEQMTDEKIADEASEKIALAQHFAYRTYNELIEMGVAKEQARCVLSVGIMKEQVWSVNLRSFMHFLSLRMDKNAQKEIRMFAHAAYKLALPHFPVALEAFKDSGWIAP